MIQANGCEKRPECGPPGISLQPNAISGSIGITCDVLVH